MCDYTELDGGASFEEKWGFPSDVVRSVPTAIAYEIVPTGEAFRSGRPRFTCRIFGPARVLLGERDAMELKSKRTGSMYHVVSKVERRN